MNKHIKIFKNKKKIINQMLYNPGNYNKHTINLYKSIYAFYLNYYWDYINLISKLK